VITLDTSGLYALLDRREKHHEATKDALLAHRRPYLVPAGILGELAYLVERTLGGRVLDAFLQDVERGGYIIECGENDIARIRELTRRYSDLPLGFVDSAVIACAARCGGDVLTLDLRHFGVVAGESELTLFP
jgi:uncharacterized protein